MIDVIDQTQRALSGQDSTALERSVHAVFLTVLKQKQSRACYTRKISRLLKAALGERVYICVST